MLNRLRSFLRAVIGRRRFEDEMSAEVRFHLDARAADLERLGLSRADAARRARAEFGGVDVMKEDARRARGLGIVEWGRDVAGDVRRGCRTLSASPLFVGISILSMGLAIGANVAVFAVVDSLLLRPLPLADQDRLVSIRELRRSDPTVARPTSYATFEAWRTQAADAMELAALRPTAVRLTDGDEADRYAGARVSWNLFGVLDLQPAFGRSFISDDDRPGAQPVALLSDALWQERYAGRHDVVGSSMVIDGVAHTIVGIMPRDLSHLALRRTLFDSKVWTPITAAVDRDRARDRTVTVYARLLDDTSREAANTRLDVIARALEASESTQYAGWRASADTLMVGFSSTTRLMLTTAMGAVAFLLCLVCANFASLTLARTGARRRDIATRLALGASRPRIVRQLFSETAVLVAASLPLGVAAAHLALQSDAGLAVTIGVIDSRALWFAILVAIGVGVLSGLVPALLAVRSSRVTTLAGHSRSHATVGPEYSWLSAGLVVAEVALAVTLLIGASLFARSFQQALHQEGTIDTSHILMVTVSGGTGVIDESIRRLAALPGVLSVAASTSIPLRTAGARTPLVSDHDKVTAGNPMTAHVTGVTAAFFESLKVPITQGRMFSPADVAAGTPVAVVNRTLARRVWPGVNPIGTRVRVAGASGAWLTVVGVSEDILSWDVSNRPVPTVHVPYAHAAGTETHLIVRAAGDPSLLIRPARDAMLEVDPTHSVGATTMTAEHHSALSRNRSLAWLFSLVGSIALLLASFGVYGVLSYFVSARTYEVGVRAALGADRRALVVHFMKMGMKMLAAGALLGTAGALSLVGIVRGLLHGVSADPIGIAGVVALLTLIGATAAWLPARRAAAVDPLVALRDQ